MVNEKSLMQFYSDTIDEKLLEVDTKRPHEYVAKDKNIRTLTS